ncbi:MAG: DUF4286 family protein [Chitinophagales bacterium]
MIVYTLTANVDEDIAEEWLQWMKDEVLHFVLETQLPVKYKVFKVLNDNEGVTFTFQIYFKDVLAYKAFLTEHHPAFSKMVASRYGDKAVYFNTLLQQL